MAGRLSSGHALLTAQQGAKHQVPTIAPRSSHKEDRATACRQRAIECVLWVGWDGWLVAPSPQLCRNPPAPIRQAAVEHTHSGIQVGASPTPLVEQRNISFKYVRL